MRDAVLILALLAPTAALAQDSAPGRVEFIAAIEKAGCHLAEKEAGAVLEPLGFTQDMVRPIVDDLVTEGLAVVDETGLTLKTEKCI